MGGSLIGIARHLHQLCHPWRADAISAVNQMWGSIIMPHTFSHDLPLFLPNDQSINFTK